jgi:hypothetical protein
VWDSLALSDPDKVRISAPTGQGNYNVRLSQHLSAVRDDETLFVSVLLHSYALAESAAAAHLKLQPLRMPQIEDWGESLLQTTDASWTDVKDGREGLVEVAVLRNTFAHGSRMLSQKSADRLARIGVTSRPVGSAVTLSYTDLRVYRARLLSLLQSGGVGR